MSIEVKIAVGVGEKFAIVNSGEIKHISLKNTNTLVTVDGETYPLYKGKTFAESQKVDDFFGNNPVTEKYINDHIANREQEYDVTITRFGCAKVKATSVEEAIKKANALPTSEITWNEDWTATDAYAED